MTTPGKHRISRTEQPHDATRGYSSPVHEREPASAVERGVHIKRIYDEPARADGSRVLVDRIWPRGITKEDAALDDWVRELAPSTELRKWFGHDPKRWPEFRKRYRAELRQRASQLDALRKRAAHRRVTLLYGARADSSIRRWSSKRSSRSLS